ncbi:hypothetical protein D3C84_700970 [compost metagenome]
MLPPGVAQLGTLSGAMVDFVEYDEDTVIIKQLPERFLTVFHGLISEGCPHGPHQAIQPPAEHRREGRLKPLHDLA